MYGHSYHRKSNLARSCEFFSNDVDDDNQPANSNSNEDIDIDQGDFSNDFAMAMDDERFQLSDYSSDENLQSTDQRQPDLTFLFEIACLFNQTNLNDSATKKIYELMVKISRQSMFLPPYTIFKRQTTMNETIRSKNYFFCGSQHLLIDNGISCCSKDVGKFIKFDLPSSIAYIVKNNKEYLWPYQRHDKDMIGDFTDSKEYKRIWLNNDNPDGLNLTLMLNVDDAAMVKSSKMTATPISFVIAELPPHRRYVTENVMLAGIWWGPCKVNHDELWKKALLDDLNLFEDGLNIFSANESIRLKIKIGLISMDSVAKPKSMNIVQFNGYYGCPYCLVPGKSMTTNRGGSVMVYPFSVTSSYNKKDHVFYTSHAKKADEAGKGPVMGIKGSSVLSNFIKFPDQVPIDYMHCWLEGVFKTTMSMKPFTESNFLHQIDNLVASIKYLHEFSRKFRKLSEISYWKAHECKTFICYLLPLLKKHLEPAYFILLMAMTFSLRLLITDKISLENIYRAEELIRLFLLAYQSKFGEREMKFNFHLLTHIPDQVREQGSLVHSSAFVFENNIFRLKTSFHGSRGQVEQIARNYVTKKSMFLSTRLSEFNPNSSRTNQLISVPTTLLGEPLNGHLMDTRLNRKLIFRYGQQRNEIYEFYSRAKKGKTVYHSLMYTYRRDCRSYYFCYKNTSGSNSYGQILHFIKVPAEIAQHGHAEILVCFNQMIVIDHSGLFAGLSSVRSSHFKSIVNIVKEVSLFNKLKLTDKIELVTLSSVHSKAIVYNESNESNVFWGTSLDTAYEHD